MKAATAIIVLIIAIGSMLETEAVWPQPSQMKTGTGHGTISNGFKFVQTGTFSQFLQNALNRYQNLTFPFGPPTTVNGQISVLGISVANLDETLSFGVSETYTLSIDSSFTATLTAPSLWGALHGLETFSQLVSFSSSSSSYSISLLPISISDSPRYFFILLFFLFLQLFFIYYYHYF